MEKSELKRDSPSDGNKGSDAWECLRGSKESRLSRPIIAASLPALAWPCGDTSRPSRDQSLKDRPQRMPKRPAPVRNSSTSKQVKDRTTNKASIPSSKTKSWKLARANPATRGDMAILEGVRINNMLARHASSAIDTAGPVCDKPLGSKKKLSRTTPKTDRRNTGSSQAIPNDEMRAPMQAHLCNEACKSN